MRTGNWPSSFLLLSLFPVSTERKKKKKNLANIELDCEQSLIFLLRHGRMLETFSLAARGSEGKKNNRTLSNIEPS